MCVACRYLTSVSPELFHPILHHRNHWHGIFHQIPHIITLRRPEYKVNALRILYLRGRFVVKVTNPEMSTLGMATTVASGYIAGIS